MKGNALWLEPVDLVLDYQEAIVGNELKINCVRAKQYNLKELCELFFSVPQVLQGALTYMEASNDQGTVRDVKDGTLFQATCGTKPFVLFYDELECGNALGSHKGCQKLGVIYASLRCFEPYMYAELESILPYIIIPSKGLKSLDRVLKKSHPRYKFRRRS